MREYVESESAVAGAADGCGEMRFVSGENADAFASAGNRDVPLLGVCRGAGGGVGKDDVFDRFVLRAVGRDGVASRIAGTLTVGGALLRLFAGLKSLQRAHIWAAQTRRHHSARTSRPAGQRFLHRGSTSSRPKPIFPTEEAPIRRPKVILPVEESHSHRPKPILSVEEAHLGCPKSHSSMEE